MYKGPNSDRLRTFERWRAVSLAVGIVLLALPLMIVPGILADVLAPFHPMPGPIDAASIGIALSLFVLLALGPLLDVPLADVFVEPPGRGTLWWVAFGTLLVGTIVVTAVAAIGGTLVADRRPPGAVARVVLAAVLLAAWAGILEELLIRGYLLSLIGNQWNWPAAVAVTSGLFALFHHGHATSVPSLVLYLGTTAVAGVLFALVTLSTGSVWNAVAIHATWNTLFSARIVSFGESVDGAALLSYALVSEPPFVGGGMVELPESPLSITVLLAGVGVVVGIERWRSP